MLSTLFVRKLIKPFSTVTIILSQNSDFLSSLVKVILTFQVIKKCKHYLIIVASRQIEYYHTENFSFPVLSLSLSPAIPKCY